MMMIENPRIIPGGHLPHLGVPQPGTHCRQVTNIAERVVYMVTGKMEEMNVSRY